MCMADLARDDGSVWYSIDSLADFTCFSKRAVIDAIKSLESDGFLEVERRGIGRSSHYRVIAKDLSKVVQQAHQCSRRTSAVDARQVVQLAPQLVQLAPKVVQEVHPKHKKHQEASVSIKSGPDKPADVSDQIWQDFKVHRKAKKAAITQTALDGMRREAGKAGVSLESAMATCCERGWVGFKASWAQDQPTRGQASETAYQRSMRERMEVVAPMVAAKAPGASRRAVDLSIFDAPLLEKA